MLSGRRLDLLDPAPLDIEIEDIAHGLSFVARWNGQTKGASKLFKEPKGIDPTQMALHLRPPMEAKAAFLERFEELLGAM